MGIDVARPLVDICVQAVKRAADAYMSLDVEMPMVTNHDKLTNCPSD